MPGTPPTTSRLAIPRIATTDTDDVPRDLNAAVDQIDALAGRFESGLLAARPSTGAGIANRFYFATDDLSGGPSGTLYRDAGGATPTWQRINPANVESAFSAWRPLFNAWGVGGPLNANFLYAPATNGSLWQGQATSVGPQAFNFDPVALAATGRTLKLRTRGFFIVNATAVGQTITLGLSPITTPGGGTGQLVFTVGGMITGSGFAISAASLTAGAMVRSSSPEFDAPAAGIYAPSLLMGGTQAAASFIEAGWTIEYRYV